MARKLEDADLVDDLNQRLQKIEDLLDRNEVTPAEALLSDMTREHPATGRVGALWKRVVQGRPKVERQRLAETAAQSACRRAQSAIAEGAFAVAVRYTDEALALVADHPSLDNS